MMNLHSNFIRITLATALGALLSSGMQTHAQVLEPVDQAVADQDPLGLSIRQMEPGLGSSGQQSALFMLTPSSELMPGSTDAGMSLLNNRPRYLRLDYGFRATLDRIDYVVRNPQGKGFKLNRAPVRDGEFFELAGPNTVFELQPLLPGTSPLSSTNSLQQLQPDARLDGRIDGRIDARLNDR